MSLETKRNPMNPTVEDVPDEDLPFASPPYAPADEPADDTQTQTRNETTAETTARRRAESNASTIIANDTNDLSKAPTTAHLAGVQSSSSPVSATINRITTQGPALFPSIHRSHMRPQNSVSPSSQPTTTPPPRARPDDLFYVTTVKYLPSASAAQTRAYPLQHITRSAEVALGMLRAITGPGGKFEGRRVEGRVYRMGGGRRVEDWGTIAGRGGWEVVRADVWECFLGDEEGWEVGGFGREGEPGAFGGRGSGWDVVA